jgi:hypothetical protein
MKKADSERLAEWRNFLDINRARSDCVTRMGDFAARPMDELSKAAKYFDLDHAKPADAAILLRILAKVIFEARAPNRPIGSKKWGLRRLFLLGVHRMLVEKEIPRISDRKAGAKIKQRFPKVYRHDDPRTIRQRLPAARLTVANWLEMGGFEAYQKRRERGQGKQQERLTHQEIMAKAGEMSETLERGVEQAVADGHITREEFDAEVIKFLMWGKACLIAEVVLDRYEEARALLSDRPA